MMSSDSHTLHLKQLSIELRDLVSAAMDPDLEQVDVRVAHLLEFVEGTDALQAAVHAAEYDGEDPLEVLRREAAHNGRLRPRSDRRTELGFLHTLLRRIVALSERERDQLVAFYDGKRKVRDAVSVFLDDTVNRYYGYLRRVVSNALLAQVPSAHKTVEIRNEGHHSQIVVQAGVGSVHASYDVSPVTQELRHVLEQLARELKDSHITDESRSDVQEAIGIANTELGKPKPGRVALRAAKGALESAAALTTLGPVISKLMLKAGELIDRLIAAAAG